MKLNFRQGIARHQTDVNGNPTFLQRSGSGQFVDLVVSPDPTVLVFAHRDATYVVEEAKTVSNAWGPIVGVAPVYLYWDLNLLNATLSRGITLLPPIYSSSAPVNPSIDQNWFDTDNCIFRVFTAKGWVEKVRIFAGSISSGAIIRPYGLGSQAGLVGDFEGGNILLDSFSKPLRQADGSFLTSVTQLNVVNLSTVTTRVEGAIVSVMASEEIPKNSAVQLGRGGRAILARSTDRNTRIAGIIVEDLYEGEVGKLISHGLVRASEFAFTPTQVKRPLFAGPTGQITTVPPVQGVLQQIGFVEDTDAIYLQIHQPIVLDSPADVITPPPPPPVTFPTANFTASVTSGTAPLSVDFMSTATGATTIEWDFFNDGFAHGTGNTITYSYGTPGIYTVRQRAINFFGHADEIKANYITVLPAVVPGTNTNLGLKIQAPVQVTGGQPFVFTCSVSNDGLADASVVTRTLRMRTNNLSTITILMSPPGATVTKNGDYTYIALPLIPITSGQSDTAVIQALIDSTVSSIIVEGTATSPEADSEYGDNTDTLTIGVKP